MSKIAKGVGKAFKKIAPVAISVGLGYVTGGASGAVMGGAKGLLGSALSGGGSEGAKTFPLPEQPQPVFRSLSEDFRGPPVDYSAVAQGGDFRGPPVDYSAIPESDTSGLGLLSWVQKNPDAAKIIAGAVGGAAQGYSQGKRFDRLLEERKRQFDNPYRGAFYGRRA